MRRGSATQSLSYPLRLPYEAQADALRLLDVSREVIDAVITSLWDRLDEFGIRDAKYAYKQVEEMIRSPQPHGHRQWRCEAEQAGRILRGQAERKKQFALILPILSQGMIEPKTEKKKAGKSRKAIKEALADLRDDTSDGGTQSNCKASSNKRVISILPMAVSLIAMRKCRRFRFRKRRCCPTRATTVLPWVNPTACPSMWSKSKSRSPYVFPMRRANGHAPGGKRR
jgi:hypothetical protein